jgi:hypothetical protein
VAQLPASPAAPWALVENVTELKAAGKLRSSLALMALLLAQRICADSYDSGSATAALSKELRSVTDVVMADVAIGVDPLDELRARRMRNSVVE